MGAHITIRAVHRLDGLKDWQHIQPRHHSHGEVWLGEQTWLCVTQIFGVTSPSQAHPDPEHYAYTDLGGGGESTHSTPTPRENNTKCLPVRVESYTDRVLVAVWGRICLKYERIFSYSSFVLYSVFRTRKYWKCVSFFNVMFITKPNRYISAWQRNVQTSRRVWRRWVHALVNHRNLNWNIAEPPLKELNNAVRSKMNKWKKFYQSEMIDAGNWTWSKVE